MNSKLNISIILESMSNLTHLPVGNLNKNTLNP